MENLLGQSSDVYQYPDQQNLNKKEEASLNGTGHITSAGETRLTFRGGPIVSVVIPAMNEAENLPHVLPLIPAWVHEVLLVDGNSTDDTVNVARQLYPGIRVVKQNGRGKGNALRCGFEAASGDIIVMIDADGSMRPEEIGDFVSTLLLGADFAKGSRFLRGGGTTDMEWYRQLGNWGFVVLARLGFGCQFSDLCYGYNAFWRSALPALNLEADGFEIETEMNLRAHTSGLKVIEVPSFEDPRIYGTSNLNTITDGWRVLKTLLREWGKIGVRGLSFWNGPGKNLGRSPQNLGSVWLELEPNISYSAITNEAPQILHSTLHTVNATTGSLIVLDQDGQISDASMYQNGQIERLRRSQVVDTVRDGLAGWVVKNQQAALVENTCDDPRWLKRSWDFYECSSRSAISLPLVATERIAGVLTLVNADKTFTGKDLVELTGVAI